MAILPELVLLIAALVFFCISLRRAPDPQLVRKTALASGVGVFLAVVASLDAPQASLFHGTYTVDAFSQMFKLLIGMSLVFLLILGKDLKDIHTSIRPEYYMFLLLSVLGLMLLVSSAELITIFVSLEFSSFALYLLVPMRNDRTGTRVQMEAGIKYILFGVMGTGFMLFGMSYLFGLSGSTYFKDIVPMLAAEPMQPAKVVAVVMVLAGFFYKLAVFPMHFWVPDIYQGASNETTALIATLPKFGAVALLIRFLALPTGHPEFLIQLLAAIALCSMFYGNLCALVQKDIKRLLGFSGIAHGGFVLLGLLTLKAEGFGLAVYYVTGYVLMNLACFLVISAVSREGENLQIEDFNGLSQRQPLLALTLAVGLFSLAGIPPFIGFMAKFSLLASALTSGHLIVVILAAINTAIAIYYYLCVVKAAYTEAPEGRGTLVVDQSVQMAGIVLVIAIVLLGIFPVKFITIAGAVITPLL